MYSGCIVFGSMGHLLQESSHVEHDSHNYVRL